MKLYFILFSVLTAVAYTKAFDEDFEHRSLGLKSCQGRLVSKVIDFEEDSNSVPFRSGDTPSQLPYGVAVGGEQYSDPLSDNDLVIFDTANPTGGRGGNLRGDEGMVLVVNSKRKKNNPNPSELGGDIRIAFEEPVYSIDKIRFLNIRETHKNYVFALTADGKSIPRLFIRPGGKGEPVDLLPLDFFNVELFEIYLREPAAVALIEYSICDGQVVPGLTTTTTQPRPKKCDPGFQIKSHKCKKCKKGFFSRKGTLCKKCKGNKIAPRKGSTSCEKCPDGYRTNKKKTKCKRKRTPPPTDQPSLAPAETLAPTADSPAPTTAVPTSPSPTPGTTFAPTDDRAGDTPAPSPVPATPLPTNVRSDTPAPTSCNDERSPGGKTSGSNRSGGKMGGSRDRSDCPSPRSSSPGKSGSKSGGKAGGGSTRSSSPGSKSGGKAGGGSTRSSSPGSKSGGKSGGGSTRSSSPGSKSGGKSGGGSTRSSSPGSKSGGKSGGGSTRSSSPGSKSGGKMGGSRNRSGGKRHLVRL